MQVNWVLTSNLDDENRPTFLKRIVNPSKTDTNLKYIPSPYRAVNTLRLGYNTLSVNVV